MKQKLFTLLMLLVTSVTGAWADNVCKIKETGTEYATIDAAVTAATDGNTIVLTKDVQLSASLIVHKSINFDLGGHTVTSTNEGANGIGIAYGIVYWRDNTSTTDRISGAVYNGTINCNRIGVYAADLSDLIVENLTVTQTTGNVVVDSYRECALAASDGATLTVNSGTYKGVRAALIVMNSGATVTINGGTYEGTGYPTSNPTSHYVVENYGTQYYSGTSFPSIVNITGGAFKGQLFKEAYDSPSKATEINVSGGMFSQDPTQNSLVTVTSGTTVEDNAETTTKDTYPWIIPMAQIGTTNYASLVYAVAAAPTTETTIKMLTNEVMEGNNGATIPSGKNIILDLNGKTISNDASIGDHSAVINNYGTLTITDNTEGAAGVVTNKVNGETYGNWSDRNWSTNAITNCGTLTLTKGSVINTSPGLSYAVDNRTNGNLYTVKFTMDGGKLQSDNGDQAVRLFCNSTTNTNDFIMNGGEIVSGGFWIQMPNDYNDLGSVTINGGTINGFIDLRSNGTATATFNGGTYNETSANKIRLRKTGGTLTAAYATISGGKWNICTLDNLTATDEKSLLLTGGVYTEAAKTALGDTFLKDGYIWVANSDTETKYTYKWTVGQAVAQIGDVKYTTLAAAVAAVPTDGTQTTITMIADETTNNNAGITIAATQNIVLDLNGKAETKNALDAAAASNIITNNGTLKITDSSTNKDGKLELIPAQPEYTYSPKYAYDVIANHGTLTVEAGSLLNTETCRDASGIPAAGCYTVDCFGGSSLTITGGTLKCGYIPVRTFATTGNDISVSVSGGTLEGMYVFFQQQASGAGTTAKSNVNVTGGTFNSVDRGIFVVEASVANLCTVNVSNGLFKYDECRSLFNMDGTEAQNITVTGGYYSTSSDKRATELTPYLAKGYKAIANDGLNSSASVETYPTMIGQVTQENQQIDVKEGGSGEKTATASVAITATPQAGDATITTEVQQKINATTTVSGVELTTTASEGETSGIQTIVNNAKTKEGSSSAFTTNIPSATNVDVHVDVKVTPSNHSTTEAKKSIKYDLEPVATVTYTIENEGVTSTYTSTSNDVTNAMIDQTKDITVSIYTGFKPISITHNEDDGTLIETFTESGDKTFTYDATTGKATVTIHRFSSLTANRPFSGTVYAGTSTAKENQTVSDFTTTRETYPNAVMIVDAANKEDVEGVDNVIIDNGASATPRYTCANFVLTDLCESKYDAMGDEELKDVINFYSPVTFTATAGSYHRSLRSGYNSACVPFALSSIDNASLLKYSYFDATSGHIYFSKATSIAAGEATIILTSAATEWNEDLAGKEIVGSPVESTGDTFFGGVFVTTDDYKSTAGATGYYSVNTENGMFAALKNYLFPLRACFKLTMSGQTAREFSIAIIDGSATGIDSIGSESISDNSIYTIDGKRVESTNARGMYIINGKKVIK